MKVSVIVPVYNVARYLSTCIDSVLNQTFTDFELLLINDGSTDNSGEICDKYAQKDTRVNVFHKVNGGVSSARNLGLDKATGEYITFMDSDDWFSEDYFNPVLKYSHHDWILVNMNRVDNGLKTNLLTFKTQSLSLKDFLETYNLYPHFAGPCAKFYKNDIIKDSNIKFNEKLSRSEDVIFNLEYIFNCKTIALSGFTSYNYRNVSDSLSHKNVSLNDAQYIYNHIYSLLLSYSSNSNFISRHNSYSAERYFFTVLNSNIRNNKKKQIMKQLIKRHKQQLMISVTKQRIHLLPVKWLLNFELLNVMIFLAHFKRTRKL